MTEKEIRESDESSEEKDYSENQKNFKESTTKQSFKSLKQIDGKYKKSALEKNLKESIEKLDLPRKIQFGKDEIDSPTKKREPNLKQKPKKSILKNLRRRSLEKKLENSAIKVIYDQRKASLNVDLFQRKQFLSQESPERKNDSFLSQLRKLSSKEPELIDFLQKAKFILL